MVDSSEGVCHPRIWVEIALISVCEPRVTHPLRALPCEIPKSPYCKRRLTTLDFPKIPIIIMYVRRSGD